MVTRSIYKKIQSLQKGDIIRVKETQKTYSVGWKNGSYLYKTITPGDDITVNNSKAPYVRKTRKDMHDYFVAGSVTVDGEECYCGIDYENVDI